MVGSIITNKGGIYIRNAMANSNEKLINNQSQLASGLKDPDPSKDPSSNTIAVAISGKSEVAESVLSVVNQGESILQIAIGVLQSDIEILSRMKNLAFRASSSHIDYENRTQINTEYNQLLEQLDLNSKTSWGKQNLFDGSYTDKSYQIGLNLDDVLNVSLGNISIEHESMDLKDSEITTKESASETLSKVTKALDYILEQNSQVASYISRLKVANATLSTMNQNLQGALSSYRDAEITFSLTEAQRHTALTDSASAALQNNAGLPNKLARLIQSSLNG